MRFKYLFLGFLLLIVAGSITAIAADDNYASLGDYTFDIPDGYQIIDENDNSVTMQQDDNHSVIVYYFNNASELDELNSLVEKTGCKFGEEQTFQSGNFNVTEKTYSFMDIQGYSYICDDGKGTPILIVSANHGSENTTTPDQDVARKVVESLE